MQALAVSDLVQVRVWCSDTEQAAVNSVWYAVAAVGALAATDQDVATQFDGFLAATYKLILANTATYRGVQAQIYGPLVIPPRALYGVVFDTAGTGVGSGGAIALPRQTCGLGSFQSNLPGARGRGRIYYPFPPAAADAGDGTPSGGYQTDIQAITSDLSVGANIVQGGRQATLVRILVHGLDKNGVPITPVTPVTGFSISSRWATQRRRGSFGRPNASPI